MYLSLSNDIEQVRRTSSPHVGLLPSTLQNIILTSKSSDRKFCLVSNVYCILRRHVLTHLSSTHLPYVQYWHVLGRNRKGGWILQLLYWNPQGCQDFQIQHCAISLHNCGDGDHGKGWIHSLELEYRSICGNLPTGNALCMPFIATNCIEPRIDDILLVRGSSGKLYN